MRWVAAILLVGGCGGTRRAPDTTTGDDVSGAPTEVICYAGDAGASLTGVEGTRRVTSMLLRRTVAPAFHRITEEWRVPGQPEAHTDLYTVDEEAGTASVTSTGDEQVAHATLVGERWHWDGWRWDRKQRADTSFTMQYERTATTLLAFGGESGFEGVSSIARELTVFDCAEWDARTAAAPPPVAEVRCYAGTRSVARFGHDPYVVDDIVLRRTIEPAKSEIVEEWGSADSGDLDVRYLTIDGDTYTTTGHDAAWARTAGTLEGEPWRWTAWRWSRRDGDGGAESMAYRVTADGLEGEGGSGSMEPEITILEHLAELDCAAWDARRAAP